MNARAWLVSAFLLVAAACDSGTTSTPAPLVLHWTQKVGGKSFTVSQPLALNLQNIGDNAVIFASEGATGVRFALSGGMSCRGIVAISPGAPALTQTVTSVGSGQCVVNAQADDGQQTSLDVFALPPP
jgi:hypothetical protein